MNEVFRNEKKRVTFQPSVSTTRYYSFEFTGSGGKRYAATAREIKPCERRLPDGRVVVGVAIGDSGLACAEVGFLADELAEIERHASAAQAEWDASPEGIMERGLFERSILRGRLDCEIEDAQADFERGFEDHASAAYDAKAAHQPEIDKLRAALTAFDEAHPEVAAEAKRRAQVEREARREPAGEAHPWL